jgi:hypothetical protein
VFGGNDNADVYPADPIGTLDLDGMKKKPRSCGFWCRRMFDAIDRGLGDVVCRATGVGNMLCSGLVTGLLAVALYAHQCCKRCWSTKTAAKKSAWNFAVGAVGDGAAQGAFNWRARTGDRSSVSWARPAPISSTPWSGPCTTR